MIQQSVSMNVTYILYNLLPLQGYVQIQICAIHIMLKLFFQAPAVAGLLAAVEDYWTAVQRVGLCRPSRGLCG